MQGANQGRCQGGSLIEHNLNDLLTWGIHDEKPTDMKHVSHHAQRAIVLQRRLSFHTASRSCPHPGVATWLGSRAGSPDCAGDRSCPLLAPFVSHSQPCRRSTSLAPPTARRTPLVRNLAARLHRLGADG